MNMISPLPRPSSPVRRRLAFSLVELLVVVAVIAVVISFAIPAANSMLKGSQLTQGSQALGDQIAFARQTALSRNRPVEVRFYRYADLDTPGEKIDEETTWKFRAFQLFEIMENSAAVPLNKMQRFPKMVIADPDKYSTLLRKELRPYKRAEEDMTTPEIPVRYGDLAVGRRYEYASFRFLQDGSTDLPPTTNPTNQTGQTNTGDSWYLTLIGLNEENRDINTINFYTLQVDPISGSTKAYRPGS